MGYLTDYNKTQGIKTPTSKVESGGYLQQYASSSNSSVPKILATPEKVPAIQPEKSLISKGLEAIGQLAPAIIKKVESALGKGFKLNVAPIDVSGAKLQPVTLKINLGQTPQTVSASAQLTPPTKRMAAFKAKNYVEAVKPGLKEALMAPVDPMIGFFSQYIAENKRAQGDQTAKFEPQTVAQSIGVVTHDFLRDLTALQAGGINATFSNGMKTLDAAVGLNPTLNTINNLPDAVIKKVMKSISPKLGYLENYYAKNKLTFDIVREVQAGRGTPEQIIAVKKANANGSLVEIVRASRKAGISEDSKVSTFVRQLVNGVKKTFSGIGKTKEQPKLLSEVKVGEKIDPRILEKGISPVTPEKPTAQLGDGTKPIQTSKGEPISTQPSGVGGVGGVPEGVTPKTAVVEPTPMSVEAKDLLKLIKEAISAGETEAAKSIYDGLGAEVKSQLPTFENINKPFQISPTPPELKPIGGGPTKISQLAKGVKTKAEQAIREEVKKTKPEEINQFGDYQKIANRMRGFLRFAGEKKSKQTGELFREHIPRDIFGQSSDEVASDLGMTENEFMAKLQEPKPKTDLSSFQDYLESQLNLNVGDLPEYQQLSMKDQAKKAIELLNSDSARATRIALGQETPPPDIIPESIFIAVENKALQDSNYDLIRQLATSNLTTQATAMGQRIRTLAERNPDSAVNSIRQVIDAREKAFKEKFKGKTVKEITDKIAKDIKSKIKTPDKYDWNTFVNSIQCP